MQTALTPAAAWLVVLPVLLPLLGATLLLVLRGKLGSPVPLALAAVLVTGAADIALLRRVAGGPLSMTMGRWLPPFGISFTADLMGAVFATTAALVMLAGLAYAVAEGAGSGDRSGFFGLALVLLAGVDGAFLTGDLFNLYVWFEVMLIASFGLLILSGTPGVLDGAIKYGLLNFVGTSLFLVALGLLYGALGTLNMADIIGAARTGDPAVVTTIAALLLVAFSTKAAAFPVNAWLPASYHTPPAVVSALLGGLLTKVGAYALLRTMVLLLPASRDLLQPVLAALAGATLLLAPLGALAETNLRRAVGYLLIGGIGAILAGLALSGADGLAGAIAYVVHAMLTITALYLVAGLIERTTGETDIRRMAGLYQSRPGLAALFGVLLVGVAGVPPFIGFWPKLLLLQGAAARLSAPGDALGVGLAVCLLLNALLTVIAGARLWSQICWRAGPDPVAVPATAATAGAARPAAGFAVTTALVLLILGLGLWPQPLLQAGRGAAASLLDSGGYIAAVGLAGDAP